VTDEKERTIDIAIVGATGLVGGAVMDLLAESKFPAGTIYPLASNDSDGSTVEYGRRKLTVHALADFDFARVQVAIFCVPATVALEYIPRATKSGCIVIDHSPAFRSDTSVPLVQADINAEEIADFESANIIACPDSSASHIVLALQPLLAFPVSRITVHAMRAVSDIGKAGIDELSKQSIALFNLKEIKNKYFPAQIAFNVLPVAKNDVSLEVDIEESIEKEIQEIIQRTDIKISVSAVQVPVFFGHSYRLLIEFKEKIKYKQITQMLQNNRYIELSNSSNSGSKPTAVTDAAQNMRLLIDQIMIKKGEVQDLALWMVADNIHCGVASNSVQIAEILVKDYL